MYDMFYIIETAPNWYQLRYRPLHLCLSAGSEFDKRIEVLRKYVRKFQTLEKLDRFVEHLRSENPDSPTFLSPHLKRQRQSEYDEIGHAFDDIIHDTIEEVLKELRENSPVRANKKRIKPVRSQESVSPPVTCTPPNPEQVHKKVSLMHIKRTTV
jgi:uncharacterized short protein YbdD (DUF466 family)